MPDTKEEVSDPEQVPEGAAYLGVAPEYQNAAEEVNRPQFSEDPATKAREEYEKEHSEHLSKGTGIHGYTNSSNVGAQPGTGEEEEGAGREIVYDPDAPENQPGTAPLEGDALEAAVADEEEEAPAPTPAATKTASKSSGGGGSSKASVVPPE